jgi:hypothetical protein
MDSQSITTTTAGALGPVVPPEVRRADGYADRGANQTDVAATAPGENSGG